MLGGNRQPETGKEGRGEGELGRKETRQKIQDPRRKETRNEVTQFRDSGRARKLRENSV